MSWQEPVVWAIVALAATFLVRRIAFVGRSRRRRGPDVPLSRLRRGPPGKPPR